MVDNVMDGQENEPLILKLPLRHSWDGARAPATIPGLSSSPNIPTVTRGRKRKSMDNPESCERSNTGSLSSITSLSVQSVNDSEWENVVAMIAKRTSQKTQGYNLMTTSLLRDIIQRLNNGDFKHHLCYDIKNMVNHILSLRLDLIQRLIRPILQDLIQHPRNNGIFNTPVNPEAVGAFDYFERIKQPMDLGTVKKKLFLCQYNVANDIISDISLVFRNALVYNPPSHMVHQCALELNKRFREACKSVSEKLEREADRKQKHSCDSCLGKTCAICIDKCLKFDLPDLACHGPCADRIRKNHSFFISEDGNVVYCQKCYQNLHAVVSDIPGEGKLLKKQLLRRKLEEEAIEGWVTCVTCRNDYHEICVLKTAIDGKSTGFACPHCILSEISKNSLSITEGTEMESDTPWTEETKESVHNFCQSSVLRPFHSLSLESTQCSPGISWKQKLSAKSLVKTQLSNFLEQHVSDQIIGVGFDSQLMESLTIRVVSNVETAVEVPSVISANLSTATHHRLPQYLPYRQKCILLFQNIDGIDVCLYCLYVQEFDANCPAPNKSTAYIAYLDSVDYFRPPEARTLVYHEILVGYMKWIQCRGFQQCHIWSCPPRKGDNFIFWRHPWYQKTPQRDRLNRWYEDMLVRCKILNIIEEVTNMYDKYFHPFMKKDRSEVGQRKAARNSFVGSGKVTKKPVTTSCLSQISFPWKQNDNVQEHSIIPVSAPIFEGDYWVDQFRKIHGIVMSRSSSSVFSLSDITGNHRRARDLIKDLLSTPPNSMYFERPVDPVALKIESYFTIISKPMDLGTIKKKLLFNEYISLLDVTEDVRLTFSNAMKFNQSPEHPVHKAAVHLLSNFNQNLNQLIINYFPHVSDEINLSGQSPDLDSFLSAILLKDTGNAPTGSMHLSGSVDSIDPSILRSVSCSSADSAIQPRGISWGNCPSYHDEVGETKGEENGDISINGDIFTDTETNDYSSIGDDGGSSSRDGDASDSEDIPYSRRLERADSMTSVCSHASLQSGSHDAVTSRTFTIISNETLSLDSKAINEMNKDTMNLLFEKPQIGQRAISQLMFELAKNAQKDKDALFVATFTNKDDNIMSNSLRTSVSNLQVSDPDNVIPESDKFNIQSTQPHSQVKKRGRIARAISCFSKSQFSDKYSQTLSSECINLTKDIKPDASDPDEMTTRSFVSMRHSFLDMCQYNHYQFDSIRRAKHSSLMLLHHLIESKHSAFKPLCATCSCPIIKTRYHCDLCRNFDICKECWSNTTHAHPLTPYRIMF